MMLLWQSKATTPLSTSTLRALWTTRGAPGAGVRAAYALAMHSCEALLPHLESVSTPYPCCPNVQPTTSMQAMGGEVTWVMETTILQAP